MLAHINVSGQYKVGRYGVVVENVDRVGEPQEVSRLPLFLASDASSFVTGEIIRVDGGQTI